MTLACDFVKWYISCFKVLCDTLSLKRWEEEDCSTMITGRGEGDMSSSMSLQGAALNCGSISLLGVATRTSTDIAHQDMGLQ